MYCVVRKDPAYTPGDIFPPGELSMARDRNKEILQIRGVGDQVYSLNPMGDVGFEVIEEIISKELRTCRFRDIHTGAVTEAPIASRFVSVEEAMDYYSSREPLYDFEGNFVGKKLPEVIPHEAP